jgi:phospholipase C
MRRHLLRATSVLFSVSLLAQPALAGMDATTDMTTVAGPSPRADVAQYMDAAPGFQLSHQQMVDLVRSKIKYVFVIYQENRSFDSYFGTFPGADGIYSQPPAKTPGYYQPIIKTDGTGTTIVPFRIGPKQYAWDTDDLDHSHARLAAKIDVQANGVALMDKFAETEELKYSPTGNPSLEAKQFGELAMAHEDCDTVPFLWNYANKFVLFDHFFQDQDGPSTPGNLTIFAAQSGQTQYALHPTESFTNAAFTEGQGEPVLNDDDPFWGSPSDPLQNVPVNPTDYPGYGVQLNQTYATIAVTLAGKQLQKITDQDEDPADDLVDIRDDIPFVTQTGKPNINWGWYEEGYDKEVTDPTTGPVDDNGTHASYITHHDGPQYFGYISNNATERANLHGLGDFYTAISTGALPVKGGVFYLKGGYENLFGLKPANPLAVAQTNFLGDDDHPAYSDAGISEATVAEDVNAIASSKYWPESAIIITWDDSEGDYDHVPPPILRYDQTGLAESLGPRVPLILISPYAKVHQISHQQGSQSSVVRFIDEVFNLNPLATLPDEKKGFMLGRSVLGAPNLGPLDDNPNIGDLLSAFDPNRLLGAAPPLPSSFAEIATKTVTTIPPFHGNGCSVLGIIPEDFIQGVPNVIPSDFNPLPKTNPSPAS